jgi:cyclic pyranopterin phosphate synthase
MNHPNETRLRIEKHASAKMKRSLPKVFCAAPFTLLKISNGNQVYLCNYSSEAIGNLSQPPLEIFNQDAMKLLRKNFNNSDKTPCLNTLKCFNCSLSYDKSLSLIETQVQDNIYYPIEITLDDSVIEKELKFWIKNIINRVKIITFQFSTKVNFELIKLFENTSIRFRLELDATLLENIILNETFLDQFESICIKVQNKNFLTFKSTLRQKTKIEIIANQFNIENIPELFLTAKQNFNNVQINILSFLYNIDDIQALKHLANFLYLPKKFDLFFYELHSTILPFWKNDLQNLELNKLSKMYQLRWLNIKTSQSKTCPIPFSQIAIYADGSYRPCCWIGDYDLRDKDTGNNILKVWNGKKIKELRNEFISGNIKTCTQKIEELSCIPKDRLQNELISYVQDQIDPILKLHWSFNGSCNLECQMCSNWQQADEFDQSENYFQDLKNNTLPFLCEIELVGGEPFYQKRTFNLIDFMKKNNPLCIWNITTNGQFNFNDRIKNSISNLRIGLFSISIDSLKPEIFSKIRIKGDLQKTLIFLDDIIEFNNTLIAGLKFEININFVIQKDNWEEVADIIEFSKQKKIGLYISPVSDSPEFSIYSLEKTTKNRCASYLKQTFDQYQHPNLIVLINSILKEQ